MQVSGQVGPQVLSDGVGTQPARQGKAGELIVGQVHGRLYEPAYRRNVFTAYAAAQALSVVGTAMVGLQVWNGSSTYNLAILKCWGSIFVTSASVTRVVLATGTGQVSAQTSQAAITRVSNMYIGGAAPNATATAGGTFTNAPTALIPIGHNTVAINTVGEDPGFFADLEGSLIIPPQCYFAFAGVGGAATASSTDLAVMWEEVPI